MIDHCCPLQVVVEFLYQHAHLLMFMHGPGIYQLITIDIREDEFCGTYDVASTFSAYLDGPVIWSICF